MEFTVLHAQRTLFAIQLLKCNAPRIQKEAQRKEPKYLFEIEKRNHRKGAIGVGS